MNCLFNSPKYLHIGGQGFLLKCLRYAVCITMGNVLAPESIDTAAIVQQATYDDLILPRAEKEFTARYFRPGGTSSETPSVKLEDIEEVETIGDGAFGLVMLAMHKPSNNLYALKIMKKHKVGLFPSKRLRKEYEPKRICTAAVST